MKPVRLRLQAFGSYLDTETIDFGELEDRLVFLIAGDTGSGKSTILDAMCFALYGETAGAERAAEQMRSKNAQPKLITEVEFTFTLGDREFTVIRSPRQERAKQRGDGFTTQAAKASLTERVADGSDTVLATQPNKATARIQSLLGFDVMQFRQVVVLPQGEFRRFLSANSDQRETILEQLFKTTRYRDIENLLKDASQEIKARLDSVSSGLDGRLSTAGVTSITELDQKIATLKDELAPLEQALKIRSAAMIAAKTALDTAVLNNGKLASRDALKHKLDQIKATADDQKARIQQHVLASSAAEINGYFESVRRLEKQNDALTASLKDCKKDLELARTKANDARKTLDEATASAAITETLSRRIGELVQIQSSVSDLEPARQNLEQCRTNSTQAESELAKTERQHKQDALDIESLRTSANAINVSSDALKTITAEGELIRTRIERHQQLAAVKASLAKSVNDDRQSATRTGHLENELTAAKEQLRSLEIARENGHAALLATGLTDGEACPVCGSTSHPAPAKSVLEIPAAADIDLVRERVDALTRDLTTASSQRAELTATISGLQEQDAALTAAMGADASRARSELDSELAQKREIYRTTEEQLKRSQASSDQLAASEKAFGELNLRLDTLRKQAQTARDQFSAAKAAYEQTLTLLPQDLREPGALDQAIKAAEAERNVLTAKLNKAREDQNTAHKELTRWETEVANQSRALEDGKHQLEKETLAWVERRNQAGFASDEAHSAAIMPADQLKVLKAAIDQYESELARATGAYDASVAECVELNHVDTDVLQKSSVETSALHDTANRDYHAASSHLEQLGDIQAQARAEIDKTAQLNREYEVVAHVANVTNGNNELRLSLHRYALGVIFDEVLDAATHRLLGMSRGRYRLRRQADPSDQRRKSGLELDVLDEHSGHSRPVATLSGGEGFQAALALALGLAEVTQNRAGGIRLDTLFIDEGFGSLDPEALDAAIQTLIELNRSSRLIGIISHVTELKERIDTQLEIRRDPSGASKTEWRIG